MGKTGSPRLALLWVALASRLVSAGRRAAWRREWESELVAHWERAAERGVGGVAARLDLLRRALGSVVDAWYYEPGRWGMTESMMELRVAARSLARRPAFSLVVVGTLALVIGANTTLYGVARDVLLEPFPYPEPDKVVAVVGGSQRGVGLGHVTYPNLADVAAATSSFEAIGLSRWWNPALDDVNGSVVVRGATVTANFFDVLGVAPGAGRFFLPEEQGTGRDGVVVVAYGVWRDRFGADPSLVGSDLRLDGDLYRVIGVTGADYEDPWIMGGPGEEPQIWRTVWSPPADWPRSGRSWTGIARVRSDVPIEAAQEELDIAFGRLAEAYAEANAGHTMRLVPLRERIGGPARPVLLILVGSVGLLLLVACANLASLLLGRAIDREPEFRVHRALGAPASRVFVRGLAEALLLSAVGGTLGVALTVALGPVVTRLNPLLPRPASGVVDGPLLTFATAVAVGAGLLFGLAPALQAARGGSAPGREAARGTTAGRRGQRLRRALVTGELALTAALLVGAGLLGRSFQRLGAVDLGMRTDGVVSVPLHGSAWSGLDQPAGQAKWDALLDAVRSAQGVTAVGAIDYVPLGGSYSCDGIQREDQPPPRPGEGRCAEVRVVLPGAFDALGVPLQRGRLIDGRDGLGQPPVVVIDRSMADAFWPGEDPLGSRIQVHTRVHEVVGVVADMQHFGPGEETRPMVYLSAPQEGWNGVSRGLTLLVRGDDASRVVGAVRSAVAGVDPSIAVGEVVTLDGLLRRHLAGPRFRTALMGAFALVALLLAALGIAGVMSYSVSRRRREMGVRMALGARPGEVRVLVLREGARLTALGLAIGLAIAATSAGVMDALLFEISARDPWVFLGVAAVLAPAAGLACYLPARRASTVDPMQALGAD